MLHLLAYLNNFMELKYLLALWNTISKYVINGHGDPTSDKVLKFYANGWATLKQLLWKFHDQECYHSNCTSIYFFVFGEKFIVTGNYLQIFYACKALNYCCIFLIY